MSEENQPTGNTPSAKASEKPTKFFPDAQLPRSTSHSPATIAAKRILACYPDYGKAPPEFVASFIATLEGHSVDDLERMSDRHTGLPARHPHYLPTVGDIAAFAEILRKQRADRADRDRYAELRELPRMSMEEYAIQRGRPPGRFRPFPKLWEEFAGDAEVMKQLDTCLAFDTLAEASRGLAVSGPAAARATLMRPVGERERKRDPRLDKPLGPFPEHLLDIGQL